MEILRRSYYGRTAEIYGSKMAKFDIAMRTNNLTKSEINAQMETHLKAEHRKALSAMAKGMNRAIDEALKERQGRLPKEFHQYDVVPEKWTATDISAVFLSIMGIFMDVSNEHRNLDVLKSFIKLHGPQKGKEIFADWAWVHDPGAYTTVPNQITAFTTSSTHGDPFENWMEKAAEENSLIAAAREEMLGDLTSGGFSYCVVVDAKRSATGHPILMGGPQFDWQSPSALYEVGLHGGGLDVVGSTLVGYPAVMFGHTRKTAFSSTAGLNNIVDHYEERLNPGNKHQYWYKGAWREMEKTVEVIKVKGEKDEIATVYRTVHGPVFAWGEGVAYTKRLSCREDYLLGMASFYEVMKAKSVDEFRKAAEISSMTVNQYYADSDGNIAYFHQGDRKSVV